MGLFSITCETCQAKLRVRQPEAIGQILECPRCHSMVQVVPPPDWQPESNSPDTTVAETPSDFAAERQVVQRQAAAAPLAPEVAQSYSLRTIWIAVAAGAGLLAIAVGLTAAWLRTGTSEPLGTATAAVREPQEHPSGDPPLEGASTPSVPGVSDNDPKVIPSVDPPRPPEPNTPTSASTNPTPADAADKTTPTSAARPATPPTNPAGVPESKPLKTGRPKPSATAADTDHQDAAANPAATTADSAATTDNTPAASGQHPTPKPAPSTADLPPERPAVNLPTGPPEPPPAATLHTVDRSGNALQAIDVRARLADPVRQIDFDTITLANLVDLLVEMARLPITLDLDALERKGLHATAPVSIHLRDTTVGDILTDTLVQRGLTYSADGRQVVITDAGPDRAVVRYQVADLLPSGSPVARAAGLAQLADEIQTLIAPETWQSAGGDGTIEIHDDLLEIDQSRAVLYQILVFCEKLRLARGLPLKGRFPASRFPLASRTAQVRDKLNRRVTITFLEPTPLPEIVRYIEHVTGLTIAIDWRPLLPEGITPWAGITCGVTDKPVAEALTTILSPLGLDWRVVHDDSIQLVTQATVTTRFEVEFYPAGETLNPQQLVDRLRKEVSSDSWQGTGGKGVIVYDPPSGHLMVLQTQPVQRQVEQWLSRTVLGAGLPISPPTSPLPPK